MADDKRVEDKTVEQKTVAQAADIEASVKRTAGQRAINAIWEVTQAIIALSVTLATLYAAVTLVLKGQPADAAFLLLSNAFFLVIGFYFGRTNHQRIGGVGPVDGGR